MADYASQLYGMISGVGDAYQEGRRQKLFETNADRNYQQQLNEFDWRKNTDQRDYMRQLSRDQVGDSQWQQSFGLQGAQLGLSRERLAMDRETAGLPQGYRRTADGNMSYIPGGPADPTTAAAIAAAKGNAPSGYRWSADGQSLEPIPGGPGTTVPAEVGARVGMANSFLDQGPTIRQRIANGEVTGPIDRAMAGNMSSSNQAEVYRQMQSGVDALQRMLTGAGMPVAEAQQYAGRYLPGYTDDANSMLSKFDQLTRELQTVEQTVTRGRGGTGGGAPQPGQGAASGAAGGSLDRARAAIASGADRNAVIERLRQNGIDPSGL